MNLAQLQLSLGRRKPWEILDDVTHKCNIKDLKEFNAFREDGWKVLDLTRRGFFPKKQFADDDSDNEDHDVIQIGYARDVMEAIEMYSESDPWEQRYPMDRNNEEFAEKFLYHREKRFEVIKIFKVILTTPDRDVIANAIEGLLEWVGPREDIEIAFYLAR